MKSHFTSTDVSRTTRLYPRSIPDAWISSLSLMLLLFLISAASALAQSGFFRSYYPPDGTELTNYGIVQCANGDYVMAGRYDDNQTNGYAHIMRVDINGAEIWSYHYPFAEFTAFERLRSVKELANGHIVVVGVKDVGPTLGLILEVDANGGFVRAREFFNAGNSELYEVALIDTDADSAQDDGIIATGYVNQTPGDLCYPVISDVCLTRMNANLTIGSALSRAYRPFPICTTYIPLDYDAYTKGHSVRQTYDAGYIVAGEMRDPAEPFTFEITDNPCICGSMTNDGRLKAFLLKTNGSLNQVWMHSYAAGIAGPFAGTDLSAASVKQTQDGGYIVTGSLNPLQNGAQPFLFKTDPAGNVTWSYSYTLLPSSLREEAQSVIEVTDPSTGLTDGYLVAGWSYPATDTSHAFFLKLDTAGAVEWSKINTSDTLGDYAREVIQVGHDLFTATGFGPIENPGGGLNLTLSSAIHFLADDLCSYDCYLTPDTERELLSLEKHSYNVLEYSYSVVQTAGEEEESELTIRSCHDETCDAPDPEEDEFHRTYNKDNMTYTDDDKAYSMAPTLDNQLVMCGETNTSTIAKDIMLVKTDLDGNQLWSHTISVNYMSSKDIGYSVREYATDQFAIAGVEVSTVGGIDSNFLVTLYDQSTGGSSTHIYGIESTSGYYHDDVAKSIRPTDDGGFIVAGYSNSFYSTGNPNLADSTYHPFVVKTDANGAVIGGTGTVWAHLYGFVQSFPQYDVRAYAVEAVDDDGDGTQDAYVVVGGLADFRGSNISGFVLKLDLNGGILWTKNTAVIGNSVRHTSDGKYLVGGIYRGQNDNFAILLVNTNGSLDKRITIDHNGKDDRTRDVIETDDCGFVIVGSTESASGLDHGRQACMLKVNYNGSVIWSKEFPLDPNWILPKTRNDQLEEAVETCKGYAGAGWTRSFSANAEADFYAVKAGKWSGELCYSGDFETTTDIAGQLISDQWVYDELEDQNDPDAYGGGTGEEEVVCEPSQGKNASWAGNRATQFEAYEAGSVSNDLQVVPNPAVDGTALKLVYQSPQEGEAQVSVFDMRGNLVYSSTLQVIEGEVHQSLPLQNLGAGVYQLQIHTESTQSITRFMMQ